ncbi:hypothetical protein ACQ4WQ_08815 [Janthinobacterium sp. GB1R12]|uniref:hypothetical protein n=1 Tax=Janthinobacterium sp. GB1R12 TaxID=3424190 RepID=UPI003F26DDBD
MNFRSVDSTEWDVIHRADGDAKKIRQRAALLIATLAEQYSQGDLNSNHGVQFSSTGENDIFGTIRSDIGEGRFTLSFSLAGERLIGNLQIEKKVLRLSSDSTWQPVWGVIVPAQGEIFAGLNPGRFSIPPGNGQFDEKRAKAIYEFGQIILYAMVKGPLTV